MHLHWTLHKRELSVLCFHHLSSHDDHHMRQLLQSWSMESCKPPLFRLAIANVAGQSKILLNLSKYSL